MNENKMEQVAKLFGKELGEEFTIKWEYLGMNIYNCRFEKDGFYVHCEEYNEVYDYEDTDLLRLLLIGEAVIVDD